MAARACSVCHNAAGNRPFRAREMMFGLRDEFDYVQCGGCGCVQIEQVPEHLERYYPSEYYPGVAEWIASSGVKRKLRHERAKYCLSGSGLFGRPTCGIFGQPDYYVWLGRCGADFSSRILDLGCGSGELLGCLYRDGFKDLTGVDPFVKKSTNYSEGFRILKQDIYGLEGKFDLIMLHHTFEHLPEPLAVLKHLHNLLDRDGHLIIRIPVASSHAYRTYGSNWAQLDAPRHLFLHTYASMNILTGKAGFKVAEVVCDSDEFQFWASEQYLRDIPLKDRRSYSVNPAGSAFSPGEILAFRRAAAELNAKLDGDSACFYLVRN